MGVLLGDNQYGKAEVRLLKVDRAGPEHALHDLNVSVALAGDMTAVHLEGDNAAVLPTDTQKNTVHAFAREHGVGEIEDFALLLARHFVDAQQSVHRARVRIEEYSWQRLTVAGRPAPHSFARSGDGTRTCTVTYDGRHARVVSGIGDLVLLSSTDSEFTGFRKDRYTTLPEATDRILCTAVEARWRHADGEEDGAPRQDWGKSYDAARAALTEAFADTYSRSLQQTLYAMGERIIGSCDGVVEVRLSLPNRHHFLVDLAPFGLDNPGEVFHVADRPYGLIEGTVLADDATTAPEAW